MHPPADLEMGAWSSARNRWMKTMPQPMELPFRPRFHTFFVRLAFIDQGMVSLRREKSNKKNQIEPLTSD